MFLFLLKITMAGNEFGILYDEKYTLDPNIARKDGGFTLMEVTNINEVPEGSICTINSTHSSIDTEQRITDEVNIKEEHLKILLANEVSKNEPNNYDNKGTDVLNVENTESNKLSDKKELRYNNNFSINALDDVKKIDTTSGRCTIESTSVNSNMAQDSLIMNINEKFVNMATQTEHRYIIRAVRSCPCQKPELSLHLRLHLYMHFLTVNRFAASSKSENQFSNKIGKLPKDFLMLQRKASDNLIYEKAKGSSSPSHISTPIRFSWRYVMPKKIV